MNTFHSGCPSPLGGYKNGGYIMKALSSQLWSLPTCFFCLFISVRHTVFPFVQPHSSPRTDSQPAWPHPATVRANVSLQTVWLRVEYAVETEGSFCTVFLLNNKARALDGHVQTTHKCGSFVWSVVLRSCTAVKCCHTCCGNIELEAHANPN